MIQSEVFDKLYSIYSDEDTDLLTRLFTSLLSVFYFGVQSMCLSLLVG